MREPRSWAQRVVAGQSSREFVETEADGGRNPLPDSQPVFGNQLTGWVRGPRSPFLGLLRRGAQLIWAREVPLQPFVSKLSPEPLRAFVGVDLCGFSSVAQTRFRAQPQPTDLISVAVQRTVFSHSRRGHRVSSGST